MKTAIELISDERKRQIEEEGWTSEHDDKHGNGELSDAAVCYAMNPSTRGKYHDTMRFSYKTIEFVYPENWSKKWFKPTPENRIRELVKAGALIVAEIERLQRVEKK